MSAKQTHARKSASSFHSFHIILHGSCMIARLHSAQAESLVGCQTSPFARRYRFPMQLLVTVPGLHGLNGIFVMDDRARLKTKLGQWCG